ncbi:vegetative cell wall protein gp1-like [Mus caroli]|uniref:Vegetative cell wall protein gp1-like n=1 Tax=Mus caroli TaxID=10089 RepID=A0A6P5NY53_MUSCR|nr:vegetative cell wall protein gp1-like [Mus caroli]
MRTPNRVLTTHELATHNSSKFGARPCSGKHQQCRSESQWCVPEVTNSGSKRGPVRDQGSLNGSALLPRPFQGTSRSAIRSRPHSASHPLDATPGPGDRADSMVPLREPRPAWPAGPAAQASRSPGLAQPRAPGNKGGGGPGVEPRVGAPAWASPSPPYPGPHATPRLPTPAPRPAIPLTLQPRALLPPGGGATAALDPPPTAAPPSSSSSSPKGGRAAAAQAGAEPPRRSPGRRRPQHSPVGGASRGEGVQVGGARGRERLRPFPPRALEQLQPGQFSDIRCSGFLVLSLHS